MRKVELQGFADATGPAVSHEVVVELLGATTTRTGLRVQAALDVAAYPTNGKVAAAELAAVRLMPHPFHGDWEQIIAPPTSQPET